MDQVPNVTQPFFTVFKTFILYPDPNVTESMIYLTEGDDRFLIEVRLVNNNNNNNNNNFIVCLDPEYRQNAATSGFSSGESISRELPWDL